MFRNKTDKKLNTHSFSPNLLLTFCYSLQTNKQGCEHDQPGGDTSHNNNIRWRIKIKANGFQTWQFNKHLQKYCSFLETPTYGDAGHSGKLNKTGENNKDCQLAPQVSPQIGLATNESWLAVFYGNYPHSCNLSLTALMKMPIVYELTMYYKCQLDCLISVKCVCVQPIVKVLGKSQRGTNEILSRL